MAFPLLVVFSERGRKELIKVMRERRFLVALAMVSAVVTGSAGTSSAALIDDGFSYTQPAAELVMPFDATEGKATFLIVSNISGTSVAGGPQVSTHWTFWSETGSELADFSICLTLNDTVVVDPTKARSIDAGNEEQGPLVNLTGKRGIVTITAYETNKACQDFSATGAKIVDDAIVGAFTFADSAVGYAFGNDAYGLGLNAAGTAVILPTSSSVRSFNLEVFNPTSVQASVVVLSHLRQSAVGQVVPIGNQTLGTQLIRFATTFYDIHELPTSLPDQTVGAAKFTQISSDDEVSGLIPRFVDITTSGVVRLHPVSGFGPDDYLYSIVGQAVGPYGASSSGKIEPSASRAFIDAPASLLD